MIDIKFIREKPEEVKIGCEKKGVKIDIDKFLELDKKRRGLIQDIETLKAKQNLESKKIATLFEEEKKKEIEKLRKLSEKIEKLKKRLIKVDFEFRKILLKIPNLPFPEVKVGMRREDSEILRHEGKISKFDFIPQSYLDLNKKLDLIDLERASKVSGSRFGYLKNEGVLLEFALVMFTIENLIKDDFIPIIPPVMINEKSMRGMGYLDKAPEEIYYLERDKLYLVGTAEQSIGPMHANEIFDYKELPKRYLGFSTCFRREAGSYGKDVRGIMRVHQFDKLEMFSFTREEDSKREFEFLLKKEEELIRALNLPYRVVKLCTGELAFPSAITYDIETWLPGSNEYRETQSNSNCTDFQARRLNIRYKEKNKLKYPHTLNATAFAIGRTIIAIMENYQTKDGEIIIPEILRKYIALEKIKFTS